MSLRHSIGIVGAALLAIAVSILIWKGLDEAANIWVGMSMRLGVVLIATWMAWPSLAPTLARVPWFLWGGGLVVLAIIVIRPRLLPVAAALVAVVIAVHFGLRWAASRVK
jgi:hypothetical protein